MTYLQANNCKTWLSILAVLLALLVGCSPSEKGSDDTTGKPITAEQANANVGSRKTVCGLVASADYAQSSSGRPTFINLDKPYPNHSFTLVIWGDNRGNFGEPPERTYMNQRICVTGMIESYRNSPQIVVTTPSQITREGSGNRALTPPVPETSVEQPTTESMQGVAPIPTNSPIPRPTNTPWPTFTPTPRPTNTTTPALQRPAGRPTMCSPYNPRLEPVAGGYRHSHCARIRNDGGCDRRFRPSSYGEHYHSPSCPPHRSGEHEID